VLLSDSDREQLYELLSRHAAAGRLALDELERRVERVAEANTQEEATAVLSDLPPLPSPDQRSDGWRGRRGHGEAKRPASDWTPTSERFRDPRSGQVMRVWTDAGGGRHYLSDT
jgi:hypothetical protein